MAGDVLTLVIADDGCGFDPTRASGAGNGLGSMGRRARRLRGQFAIESGAGGTRVVLHVPLSQLTDENSSEFNPPNLPAAAEDIPSPWGEG